MKIVTGAGRTPETAAMEVTAAVPVATTLRRGIVTAAGRIRGGMAATEEGTPGLDSVATAVTETTTAMIVTALVAPTKVALATTAEIETTSEEEVGAAVGMTAAVIGETTAAMTDATGARINVMIVATTSATAASRMLIEQSILAMRPVQMGRSLMMSPAAQPGQIWKTNARLYSGAHWSR